MARVHASRNHASRVLTILAIFAITIAFVPAPGAYAMPPQDEPSLGPGSGNGDENKAKISGGDNLKHPLGVKQAKLRQQALEAKVRGKTSGKVHEVAKGQYVELAREGTDDIFTILAEFGNQIHPTFGGPPGPLHNQIAAPDRATNNTTIWQADYNRAHFEDMYFNKMARYYETQSSGRYSVRGEVTDWVQVAFNEGRYGHNACGSTVCSSVWNLLRDAATAWYNGQIAAGRTPAQVAASLARYDRWDRYDHDGDGNFNEPDGYMDHFQIVHAGVGEETGGGAQGTFAIWSHRWYTFSNLIGAAGPPGNLLGGVQIGSTGLWIGDYTIQPENGGLGVFAHEFAHDLGLPDAYDTAGGENGSGFWTIMSSGSYLGDGTIDIGSRPGDFNAWEKFQLGWLNYEVAFAGQRSTHKVGPAEINTKQAQGVFVVLPDRERVLVLGDPPDGNLSWWSGMGDGLDNDMTRTVTLGSSVTAQLWYDIEDGWDYAYVSVSTNGGATWANLAGNVTTNTDPNGQNFGNGITGTSAGWVSATFDPGTYAGQSVLLRLRYWTDGFVQGKGIQFDRIATGAFTDGAEAGANGWTLDGFVATDGTETSLHFNAYVAESRQYRGYDTGLRTGPYNYGFLNTRPNWVEHFPYQDGLLIHYWDSSMPDNNTSQHPGEGLILPVDAHPRPIMRADIPSVAWRARVQVYDATFGLEATEQITVHRNGVPEVIPSQPAAKKFDDRNDYWSPQAPLSSVIVPKTGTTIEIVSVSAQGSFMTILVR